MSPETPAAFNLVIPAGDRNAEVVSEVTVVWTAPNWFTSSCTCICWVSDYELRVTYPTGESETVFKGVWNCDWQVGYFKAAKPLKVGGGNRGSNNGAFDDNSVNNKFNPDPQQHHPVGRIRNWDEMQPVSCLVVDANTDGVCGSSSRPDRVLPVDSGTAGVASMRWQPSRRPERKDSSQARRSKSWPSLDALNR